MEARKGGTEGKDEEKVSPSVLPVPVSTPA